VLDTFTSFYELMEKGLLLQILGQNLAFLGRRLGRLRSGPWPALLA